MTSLKDTLIALSGDQTVDAQLYQDNNTWEDPGYDEQRLDIDRKLLSRFGRDVAVRECPKSVDWDSVFGWRSGEEEVNEFVVVNMRHVLEGPL